MLDDLAAVDVRGSWYQSLYDAGYNFGYSCTDPFGWGFGGGSWWISDFLGDSSFNPRFECARQAINCLMAVAEYVGGVSALTALCGGTLGAGCIGALLLHPVLGAHVAIECADAIRVCGIA